MFLFRLLLGPLYHLWKYPVLSILSLFWIIFLTILTQVGGLLFWLGFSFLPLLHKTGHFKKFKILKFLGFQLVFYLIFCLTILPFLAKTLNQTPRTALPVWGSKDFPVKPRNIFYVLLNRNYLQSQLLPEVQKVTQQMNTKYPGTIVFYLDANFPLEWNWLTLFLQYLGLIRSRVDAFPLYPHLSHWDGKKLDLNFLYTKEGKPGCYTPSWLGYGGLEPPQAGEINIPCQCQAYWFYNVWAHLQRINPCQPRSLINKSLRLDTERTRFLINQFLAQPSTQVVLLESHLDQRLKVGGRTRLACCHAVRHDDHFHIAFH